MEEYDKWNEIKKDTQIDKKLRLFKRRDIFFIKMGQNIGYEQNGKGSNFVRPIVVLKKITNNMFIGIPLSSQIKYGSWFYEFEFNTKNRISKNIAIIPQLKMYSSQRLLNKISVMPKEKFNELKQKVINFID